MQQLEALTSRVQRWRVDFPWLQICNHGVVCTICRDAGVQSSWGKGHGPLAQMCGCVESACDAFGPCLMHGGLSADFKTKVDEADAGCGKAMWSNIILQEYIVWLPHVCIITI